MASWPSARTADTASASAVASPGGTSTACARLVWSGGVSLDLFCPRIGNPKLVRLGSDRFASCQRFVGDGSRVLGPARLWWRMSGPTFTQDGWESPAFRKEARVIWSGGWHWRHSLSCHAFTLVPFLSVGLMDTLRLAELYEAILPTDSSVVQSAFATHR